MKSARKRAPKRSSKGRPAARKSSASPLTKIRRKVVRTARSMVKKVTGGK